MADNPKILQPREPLLDATVFDARGNEIKPGVSRPWWRFFNDLGQSAGPTGSTGPAGATGATGGGGGTGATGATGSSGAGEGGGIPMIETIAYWGM